jgi:hypothetical protein
MENSEDPFVQKWKKTRDKGLLRHLISSGLSFGILLFVVLTAFNYFASDVIFKSTYDFLVQLLISIIIGGGFYALMTWFLNELMYKRKTENK